jgi:hypothetical protein
MQIRVSGSWKPVAAFYGYQIQMVRGEQTLAAAGPLDTRSGFTARQQLSLPPGHHQPL